MPEYAPDPEPIPSPKRPGWTAQFLDKEKVWAEKGYEQNQHLTGAERIALVEHLRVMWHGEASINARIPRVFEFIERKAG